MFGDLWYPVERCAHTGSVTGCEDCNAWVVVGISAAAALTRFMQSLLFEVRLTRRS
jgi:hypothetical protein